MLRTRIKYDAQQHFFRGLALSFEVLVVPAADYKVLKAAANQGKKNTCFTQLYANSNAYVFSYKTVAVVQYRLCLNASDFSF